jgi:macrolide-specific efflux system membrane fusion protein
VAEAEYAQVQEANRRHRDTVPASDERRKLLAWRSAELQIEQAEFERKLATLRSDTRAAEVEAADTSIARRQIRAPLAGLVVDVRRNRGEWVQPGESVLRIVRIDRLRVDGFLSAESFEPQDAAGRPVKVSVRLPRGVVDFSGRVVFVSPLVESGQFLVRAEVENRAEGEQWLLRPGLTADMEIDAAPRPPMTETAGLVNQRP